MSSSSEERIMNEMGPVVRLGVTGLALFAIGVTPSTPSITRAIQPQTNHLHAATELQQLYGQLPLSFEANRAQVDSQVAFVAHAHGASVFLTRAEAVLALGRGTHASDTHNPAGDGSAKNGQVLRLQLLGANPESATQGEAELPGRSNYFIGSDPSAWRTHIPTYSQVHYTEVYPGIDLRFHGEQGQLQYDFVSPLSLPVPGHRRGGS
jgi:hypothetical protein